MSVRSIAKHQLSVFSDSPCNVQGYQIERDSRKETWLVMVTSQVAKPPVDKFYLFWRIIAPSISKVQVALPFQNGKELNF